MVISASLQACGVVFPFAMLTSICRSIVTICSGLYLLIGMASFSSQWILSHSTWYKLRRSRHPQERRQTLRLCVQTIKRELVYVLPGRLVEILPGGLELAWLQLPLTNFFS